MSNKYTYGNQNTVTEIRVICNMIFISLVAHRIGLVEFRIFVIVFYRQAQLKKSKLILEIRHVPNDELFTKDISYEYIFDKICVRV